MMLATAIFCALAAALFAALASQYHHELASERRRHMETRMFSDRYKAIAEAQTKNAEEAVKLSRSLLDDMQRMHADMLAQAVVVHAKLHSEK